MQNQEKCVCPEEEPGGGDVSPSFRTVLLGLRLPLADHLVSFFTPDWSLHPPHDVGTTFAKTDPPTEACGCMSTLIMRWGPLPFRPSRSLPALVQGSLL